jgi:hypothetical protein
MIEKLFGAVWFRSPKFLQSLMSQAAYRLCEGLDPFTSRRLAGTRIAAGKAIAATNTLNIEHALTHRERLPNHVQWTLAAFTNEEWKEVLRIANSTRHSMATELDDPKWANLRRTAS